MDGLGIGIGAAGFWLFIAAIVVAGIWDGAKKRESRQETLRRMVESGQKVDPALMDKLLDLGTERQDRQDRDLKVGGMITGSVGLGLGGFGWFLGNFDTQASLAMYGIGLMLLVIGGGLFIAGKYVERAKKREASGTSGLA